MEFNSDILMLLELKAQYRNFLKKWRREFGLIIIRTVKRSNSSS
jgi:hypothetical protein